MKTSNELLSTTPIISGMVNSPQLEFILDILEEQLSIGIGGDVVELGCNCGTTSIFIRKMMNLYDTEKVYHVYDSFEGLPKNSIHDTGGNEGECLTSKDVLLSNFNQFGLVAPIVNHGWFSKIPDSCYPDEICFAFFDGDFYSSILDSFSKTYHKLQPGAAVIIHDYGPGPLPGVEIACNEFLEDKPESVIQAMPGVGYFIKEKN
jgi:O-methyltransferase